MATETILGGLSQETTLKELLELNVDVRELLFAIQKFYKGDTLPISGTVYATVTNLYNNNGEPANMGQIYAQNTLAYLANTQHITVT